MARWRGRKGASGGGGDSFTTGQQMCDVGSGVSVGLARPLPSVLGLGFLGVSRPYNRPDLYKNHVSRTRSVVLY
jgi:hypothetical protein